MTKRYNCHIAVAFCILSLFSGCTSSSLFVINSLARLGQYRTQENLSYGKAKLNHLDLYIPESRQTKTKKYPVVIFFYGGCWGECSSFGRESYRFVADALTSYQFITVIADYRRYPEVVFPEIIEDSKSIVEWVRNNIDLYQGDSNQIFLMGHSAGAHLAALLTLDESYLDLQTYKSIKGFIGIAGPYDFLPFTESYQEILFGPVEKHPASQPINFVNGNEPALLLLHGEGDKKVLPRNSINLHKIVTRSGGCSDLKLYKNVNHTDILAHLAYPFNSNEPMLKHIIEFLNNYSMNSPLCKKPLG